MASPVVVDGRLTREKLDELLALAAEYAELDFKATLDLADAAHRLGLVKDIIAMANSSTGGYIVIGAYDDGRPATDQPPVEARRFDSADLAQHVARHVVAAPIVTSQAHDVEGRALVLLHVAPTTNGLPCLVSKPGEYLHSDGRTMKVVLRQGVLYVRDGTRTVEASDGHWPMLLERYRSGIVAETREGLDALIRKVVSGMGEATGGVVLSPLVLEMDDTAFAEAATSHFDTKQGKQRLRRFARSIRGDASIDNPDLDARGNALTKLAVLAILSAHADARVVFSAVVNTLYEAYEASTGDYEVDYPPATRTVYWLDVLLRVFCIGAAVVREKAWWALIPLVNRRGTSYYAIWLRHGLVHASRAGLLSGAAREAALLLIRARDLGVRHRVLTSDIRDAPEVAGAEPMPERDELLDSLCEFDFTWCTVAVIMNPDQGDSTLFYPSCAALYQHRTQPAISRLATSESTREAITPDATIAEWASALHRVLNVAVSQSHQYGGWWDIDNDPRVGAFIQANELADSND